MAERKTLLIPSLLDDWFPLLQYAFTSEEWEPVLLTEDDPHLAELGLKYFHNELCYPVFLVAGQVLSALRSGRYDRPRCGVLFGQAGDECRGSCGIRLLRRVLDRLGYGRVETLSLNVRGIDRGTGLPITAAMVRRCLAAARVGGHAGPAAEPDPAIRGSPRHGGGTLAPLDGGPGTGSGGESRTHPPGDPAPLPGDGGRIPGGGAGAP